VRVCLRCRAAMPVDAACDLPDHDSVIVDDDGRRRLVEATYGDRERRLRLLRARNHRQQKVATGGAIAGVVGGAATILLEPSRTLIMGGALLGGALGAAISAAIAGRRDAGASLPLDADVPAVPPRFAGATIVSALDLPSPASDVWCAAWSIELVQQQGGQERVVLRDAWTDGLELTLDGGVRARIPAGPWRPAAGLIGLVDTDERELIDHLRAIDRQHDPDGELAPFRHELVREALLQVGDRVELYGTWQPTLLDDPPDASEPGPYRDAPATVLVPVGWPVLARRRA
ncbi:MAG: hypothetical protein KC464_08295, partial [Myxococcales bacterium]|nr:hypothetical protein [Myxococcales bacterium]